ncbi:EcsC family protein [Bacillus badius]|uniref:EcsC protein n=1 Tax=Bacillus badius TaxID=1455 RepID=A0ABR5ATQ7_BACBA|nr:EcsC family protein [Bacillus badius]KIL73009.1 EcsC protein [Bacillus badius]KIL77553.1 EcsC protein [Bacillus badius]MED4716826.1 EcsC family protein [Bacillus badius]
METKQQLAAELAAIEKWENEQKHLGIWDKMARLPFKLLDKVTPKIIQNKLALLLEEVGSFVQTGGQYLVQEKSILKKIEAANPGITVESVADAAAVPLKKMDAVAEELKQSRANMATVQGASTGVGGVFTLAADIPLLLGLSLKTLQEIAIAYGYDPKQKEERVFIIKCLQFTSSDVVGKKAILTELASFYQGRRQSQEMISQLQGWREVMYTYRDQLGSKKMFQLIPIAGIVFGAFTNRTAVLDVAENAAMLYKKRRVMERLHASHSESEHSSY